MKCCICDREFLPKRKDGDACSDACRAVKNRRRAAIRAKTHPMERQWKEIPPPTRRQKEQMMEGLHRLLFTTEDEVRLVFGQSQELGCGCHFKGTEARL